MGYSITIEGIPLLRFKLRSTQAAIRVNSRIAMEKSVHLVEAYAKAIESPHTKTGRLFSSIHPSVEGGFGLPLVGRVGTRVKYAPFLEFGTGLFGPLHKPILPLTHQFLKFTVPVAGVTRSGRKLAGLTIFTRSVQGQRADPFMSRALDAAEDQVYRYFREAVDKAIA